VLGESGAPACRLGPALALVQKLYIITLDFEH
jgi:hypothetical protein